MIEVPKRPFDAKVMMQSIRLLRSLGRAVGNQRSLIKFEIELTRELGLFDRDFYLSQIDPASLGGMAPLRHYVLHGDAAGLWPSPLFDVRHYDAQVAKRGGINRLLHYGLVARFRGISPSPWFDADYYLRSNPDVVHSGADPLMHFQRWGWREGRSPLPGLDMRRLLNSSPELRVVKGNALALFATDWMHQYMRSERPMPSVQHPRQPLTPVELVERDMLDPACWADIHPRRWPHAPRVDVLIPVYSGLQETLRCIYSVLTAPVQTPHELVIVNDAGPVPELNAMLRSLAARGLFHLEQNKVNQGFVRTVNRGLRLHRDRDVVILNSDTEVYNNWLDRLMGQMRAHPRLATLTPLSNNATICSYPETLGDNRLPLELAPSEIDALAGRVNAGRHVTAPTGVGFCMVLRREALNDIGMLDERRFGRGYGEENDLCQRAIRRGWSNGIACDVYVRHVGSVSFKGEAAERTAHALKVLGKLYPDYDQQVARYIANDPAAALRMRIDLARLVRLKQERNVLLICHNRGGGTERHLLEQSEALLSQGFGVFELRPSPKAGCVALLHPGLYGLHNLATLSLSDPGQFEHALVELGITELHVHHLIDFAPEAAAQMTVVAGRLGIPLRIAVHDYYAVCPRINLVNAQGRFCGQPEAAECNRCLAQDRLIEQTGSIESWRDRHARLFSAAQQVVVPSHDVARRMAGLVPEQVLQIDPHEEDPPPRISASTLVPADRPVRVLVIGAISKIKGYDVLLGLAALAKTRGLPLELCLLGYSADDGRLAGEGVQLLGRYFDNELLDRIAQCDPHIILVPSVWPETYCYVLSGALRSGRRIAVFDLGAQADRTRRHDPHHLLLPLALADQHEALADLLIRSVRAPEIVTLSTGAEQDLAVRRHGS